MGEDPTRASDRNQKTRMGGTTNNMENNHKRRPYIPPAKPRGNNQGGRGNAAEDVSKRNNNKNTSQNRKGGTPKPQTNSKSNQKGFQNKRNTGGQQRVRVYSLGDYDGDDRGSNHKGFSQMHKDCKALRYKVHMPRTDCPKLLKMVQHHDNSSDALAAVMLENGKVDALVVIPDTKQKFIYVCKDTSLGIFEDDPFKAEKKLLNEIFPKDSAGESRAIETTGFKISCASCLLLGHEPNGFCLIASSSASIVDMVRDTSRSNQREKEASGIALHQDHAHFVARLPLSALKKLQRSKTRSQTGQAVDEILGHLSNQDIVVGLAEEFTGNIELGHHLLSVLGLTSRSKDEEFWLVMGYDDRKSLELDLPGGKRHLGETSLEGAIRETEEETSLMWDASWVRGVLQSNKRSAVGNRYFVLHPPESFSER